MAGKVIVVQGGQYGSEGKGQVCVFEDTQWSNGIPNHVRTGAINAGHTIYHRGVEYKMQQIPVGWTNPNAKLFLGAGAFIHPDILADEVKNIKAHTGEDIRDRLYIDKRCYVHSDTDLQGAREAGRHLTIGATGKGCAEAYIHKIQSRGSLSESSRKQRIFSETERGGRYQFVDVAMELAYELDDGRNVLVEGTQGTLLDIHHGDYPYTTSRMTTAAAWLAESGISPSHRVEVNLVLRTYPIRVAGNSGPLPGELTWQKLWNAWRGFVNAPQVSEVSERIFDQHVDAHAGIHDFHRAHPYMAPEERYQHRAALSQAQSRAFDDLKEDFPQTYTELRAATEMTTVTHKPRRIAQFNLDNAIKAVRIEKPAYLTVTFLNYLFPGIWLGPDDTLNHKHWSEAMAWLDWLEDQLKTPVRYFSTGPGLDGLHVRHNR